MQGFSGNTIIWLPFLDHVRVQKLEILHDELEQLDAEIGRFNHDFLFDSHNNRLNKDGDEYTVNRLNQIEQAGDTEFAYDAIELYAYLHMYI